MQLEIAIEKSELSPSALWNDGSLEVKKLFELNRQDLHGDSCIL